MIIAIGCDIVEHQMMSQLGWDTNSKILERVLSPNEIELCELNQKVRFIAGRFAIKEAVLKCLGTGMQDGIALTDIQILKNEAGKPILEIDGEVKTIADRLGIRSWHICITHSNNYSFGFAIAEGLET
jgi:holo-[acyl-carrier protein] synthase